MTQEEKVRAYDEALKKAQCWLNDPQTIQDCNYTIEDAIQNIFPQLKESKDEKARREIVDFIRWAIGRGSITKEQREKSDTWFAYLEKQKENTWSEEDNAKVKAMCEKGYLKPSERAWLKNLKNRVWKK